MVTILESAIASLDDMILPTTPTSESISESSVIDPCGAYAKTTNPPFVETSSRSARFSGRPIWIEWISPGKMIVVLTGRTGRVYGSPCLLTGNSLRDFIIIAVIPFLSAYTPFSQERVYTYQ